MEVSWETTHFGSLGKILFMRVVWASCTLMVSVIAQVEREGLTCGLEVREEGHNVPGMALMAFAPITDWPTPWPIPCGQVRVMARRDISSLVFRV